MAIPQIVYPENQAVGLEGDIADGGRDAHSRTRVNIAADMNFGRGVSVGAADDEVLLPTGVATAFRGITRFSHTGSGSTTATGIPQNMPASILTKGRIRVIAEEAVTPASQVFMRYQNAGASPEGIGRFTGTEDAAVAKVVTATVTAVNDTDYQLTIHFPDNEEFVYDVTGDASATATEINDDFRTKMAADAGFTARVVATGTTTLILTGQLVGEDFLVNDSGPGDWASITDTIAAATGDTVRLDDVHSIQWVTSASAGEIAVLELNLP